MPSPNNTVTIAAAGSRKTTQLIEEALARPTQRVLVVTYTLENLEQLRLGFIRANGCVPKHVTLLSWYSFLLQDCVRPYQRSLSKAGRVRSLFFAEIPDAAKYIKKLDTDRYYFTIKRDIYRDRASEFACSANQASDGAVIDRLEHIYDVILVDEMQDFSGYDFDLLDLLFGSKMSVFCACDPRQAILSTNLGRKNKKYYGSGIPVWLADPTRAKLVSVEVRHTSFRCNQAICDFADGLFPDMPKTESLEHTVTGHDSIVPVSRADVLEYVRTYTPTILRDKRTVYTFDLDAINIGVAKGSTFDRVLIFPTKPMLAYFKTKDVSKAGDRCRLYVAVTRAKYSVAYVCD